jgi:RHS repeat-associated protein
LTDPGNRTVSFGYDLDGNRTSIARSNGVDTTSVYDAAGQVSSIAHTKAAATLQSFAYTYDPAGNRKTVTTASGTETYTYDSLNRLTDVSYPGGPNVSYTYDAAGNRLTETRGGTTTNYGYGSSGQLQTVGSKSYGYDANGNLISAGADTFAWDFDNRLTSATVAGHSATYRYDGDGVRTRSVVDGVTKDLLVDRSGGLPTVVDDGTGAYLHADGLISKVTGSSATWALNDDLGSVRGLTDGAGTLVGTASYEAFGAPRISTGISTMFGFTGEPTDATGLVDLRARSLDPTTGRFLSADTVSPNAPGTGGYNLYAYVANNPATWTDPSGHFVMPFLVGLTLAAFLAAVFLFVACMLNVECRTNHFDLSQPVETQGSTGPVVQPPPADPSEASSTYPGVPIGLVAVEEAEAERCNQDRIAITEAAIAHVDILHSWGSYVLPGRSWWYPAVNWQAWTLAAKPITAAPGVPAINCVRTALAPFPIGINRNPANAPLGPTNIYTVVTDAIDGTLRTAHPGLARSYSYWQLG